jgi:hypothetical protein
MIWKLNPVSRLIATSFLLLQTDNTKQKCVTWFLASRLVRLCLSAVRCFSRFQDKVLSPSGGRVWFPRVMFGQELLGSIRQYILKANLVQEALNDAYVLFDSDRVDAIANLYLFNSKSLFVDLIVVLYMASHIHMWDSRTPNKQSPSFPNPLAFKAGQINGRHTICACSFPSASASAFVPAG